MTDLDPQTVLQQLLDEQRAITTLIEDERSWWHEIRELGKPRFGEMGTRLRDLRRHLATHFEHEESAEQSAVAIGACKATPDQSSQLKAVHLRLLARLDVMIERTNGSDEAYESWGDVGAEFSDLIRDLEAHEKSELELLRRILGNMRAQVTPSSLPS